MKAFYSPTGIIDHARWLIRRETVRGNRKSSASQRVGGPMLVGKVAGRTQEKELHLKRKACPVLYR
jgi:hypothetical protein